MANNAELLSVRAVPEPFDFDGVHVVVESLADGGNNELIVRLTASRNGDVLFNTSEEFIFRNPPIMVPDGNVRTIEHHLAGTVEIETFTTDLDAALVAMIEGTLRICIENN